MLTTILRIVAEDAMIAERQTCSVPKEFRANRIPGIIVPWQRETGWFDPVEAKVC
jgi:hypothetical protein